MRTSIATLATTISLCAAAALGDAPFDNWKLLNAVKVKEVVQNNVWVAVKEYPDALLAQTDPFTIEGFYLPIEAQGYVSTFLLIRDPAECPFCGDGGYGPSLEVTLKRPLKDKEPYSRIVLEGTLDLIDEPETFMAYRLLDAKVLSIAPAEAEHKERWNRGLLDW
jgi:hypothetical protein